MTDSNGNILIGFCLDETQSMDNVRQKTIDGYNEYIKGLQAQEGKTRMSLTLFSDVYNEPKFREALSAAPIEGVIPLGLNNYNPRGNTPLFDAIGHTISQLDSWLANNEEEEWTVLFVIQTDGEENASREYNRNQIFELVRERETSGWKFVFLGADLDEFSGERMSSAMGMSAGSSMSYAKSGTGSTYTSLSDTVGVLRTNKAMSSKEFTEAMRGEYERREKEEKQAGNPDDS